MCRKKSEIEVSIFKNYTFYKNSKLVDVFDGIKKGIIKKEIDLLRKYKSINDPQWQIIKESLPAFTASGTFPKSRRKEDIAQYNGVICLDFDKIFSDEESKITITKLVNNQKSTLGSFISPSGDGFKVLAFTNQEVEHHSSAYKQVKTHYENLIGKEADKSCIDESRLCFCSYDPQAYLNTNAEPFEIDLEQSEINIIKKSSLKKLTFNDGSSPFEKIVQLSLNKYKFEKGSRNKFIFQVACNANRWGFTLSDLISEIDAHGYNYHARKVLATVKSAYKYVEQHNTFPLQKQLEIYNQDDTLHDCNFATLQTEALSGDECNGTNIQDNVYNNLPELLQEGARLFDDKRQRDIFLTGALGVLSGCFPSIYGLYHRHVVHSNLFAFIVAPPASGKGSLKFSKYYGVGYHKHLLSTGGHDSLKSKKILFIPGNASSSAIMGHLEQNKGIGIFFESEADSLSNSLKNDWGNYSDMLRKSFHHETVNHTRKGNNEYIEVESPKLSLVLSGTPNQVQSLTKSVEDGLLSRFLFYSFKSEVAWEDVSENGKDDLSALFKSISETAYSVIEKYLKFESIKFTLTKQQWDILNSTQKQALAETTDEYGDDVASVIKRMGLMWYRIAMILTAVRTNNVNENDGLLCNDIDFNVAKALINVYQNHTVKIYASMVNEQATNGKDKASIFFDALPDKFRRGEAVVIGAKNKLKSRMADNYLARFVQQNKLVSIEADETGWYKKVK